MPVGWDVRRVAEIIPTFPDGREERGSGYQITEARVLTCGHAVKNATRVRVRFEAGTVEPSATEWEVDAGPPVFLGNDIAVLPVAAPEDMNARPLFVPAYGRVRAGLAYPSAIAVGFPSAQAREDLKRADGSTASYRDSKQAIGNLTPLSQLKSGNWEFSVTNPPPGSTKPGKSSWAGMSGASVWVAERLVGVITEDVHPKGANTLTVSPLAGLWELPPSLSAGSLEELFECSDPAAWVDVSVADSLQSVLLDHYRQVLDIAPEGGARDRQQELSQMTAFCRDEEAEGYWWWRARPWAGKTALMASFAAQAPPDLRVASFFINSQRESRRDSRAFREAILPQLDAVAGNVRPTPVTPGAEDQTLNRCLDAAAKACQEQGTHLVLVVDALDEDDRTDIGGIRPSIASLLPARPSHGLRVLVSSRPNPEIPVDVPANHPLKADTIRHELLPSPHAAEVKERATQETKKILGSEGIENEALTLIALAGALSPKEIADITRERYFRAEDVLAHCRVLAGEDRHFIENTPERVYALSHTTLPGLIKELLGEDEVRAYQGRINEWARKYSRDGWPDATPAFFLTGAYPKFLASAGELELLVKWALDRQLQTRLWQLTGSSLQSLEDIHLAQNQNIKSRETDLAAALRLCMMRNEIETATSNLPAGIPVLYARMGQHRRAFILAMSIRDSSSREQSLRDMSQVQTDTGHLHQAQATARALTAPLGRSDALVCIARALTGAGQDPIPALQDALDAARNIDNPELRSKVLLDIARALGDAGQDAAPVFQEILEAARNIDDYDDDVFDPGRRPKALLGIARAMAEAGQDAAPVFQEAVDTARNDDPERRPKALLGIARELADAGREAAPVLPDVLDAARNIDDPWWRSEALLGIARAMAEAGQDAAPVLEDALDAVRNIVDPGRRPKVLLGIARAMAEAGQDAAPVFQEALDAARNIDEWQRSEALLDVARAMAEAGQDAAPVFQEALDAARNIDYPGRRSNVLLDIARAFADTGQDAAPIFQEALDAVRNIDESGWRSNMLRRTAQALADAGQNATSVFQCVLDAVRNIDRPAQRSEALLDVARALADTGQDAAPVFQEALDAARNIDEWQRSEALLDIARALADAEQDPAPALQNALDAARSINDPGRRSKALLDIAQALADTGQDPAPTLRDALTAAYTLRPRLDSGALKNSARAPGDSGRTTQDLGSAYSIPDPTRRSMVLLDIARALADTGQDAAPIFQEALDAVRNIDDPGLRPKALLDIARAMADAGQDAAPVFQEALDTGRNYYARTDVLARITRALGDVGPGRASVFQGVLDAARNIDDPWFRPQVLLDIARALADTGQDVTPVLPDALDAARNIDNAGQRSKVLLGIARALADTGQDAAPVFQEALDAARNTKDWRHIDAVMEIARALADAGQDAAPVLPDALDAARDIDNSGVRSDGLLVIARALADTGQDAAPVFQEALDAARNAEDWWRPKALLGIARAFADAGRDAAPVIQEALDAARNWRHSDALMEIARALADAGQDAASVFQEALDAAHNIDSPDSRWRALRDLARALADTGQDPAASVFQEAVDAARDIDDRRRRSEAMLDIARAMQDTGQDAAFVFQEVLDANRNIIVNLQIPAYPIFGVARALLDADLVMDAFRCLEMTPHSSEAGTLWLEIAGKAFESGNTALACSAAAYSLAMSSWDSTIGTITKIDPGLWTIIECFARTEG